MNNAFMLKTARYATVGMIIFSVLGCELIPFTNHASARRHMIYAVDYLNRGLSDSAFASFGLALEENPKIATAHLGMGDIYRSWGNYRLASYAYERAVKVQPNNFDANYALGEMYYILGKLEKAMNTFLQAVAIQPKHFGANDNLAQVYLRLQRPGDAVPYAERAVEVDPDSQLAWAKLGLAYSRTDQHEKAVDAFRRAAELGPLNDDILLGLSISHIKLENYERAIVTLNQLISNSPSAIAHERLGYTQFKVSNFFEAEKNFKAALTFDPNDVSALNGVGVCNMTNYIQGQRTNPSLHEKAYVAWRKSIAIDPEQPHILDLMSRYQLK